MTLPKCGVSILAELFPLAV